MSERDHERQEPGLFDLPLTDAVEESGAEGGAEGVSDLEPSDARRSGTRRAAASRPERSELAGGSEDDELPLFPVAPSASLPTAGRVDASRAGRPAPEPFADGPVPVPGVAAATGPVVVPARGAASAPFGARLLAALADLGVHLVVAAVGWGGAVLAGVRVGAAELPALGVFVLAFSFLYSVVSLAFWGKSPGMAAVGVVSRGAGGQPLTFGQTGLRWLAAVLTAALLGLPLLVALTGRSLPDRFSGSRTFRVR